MDDAHICPHFGNSNLCDLIANALAQANDDPARAAVSLATCSDIQLKHWTRIGSELGIESSCMTSKAAAVEAIVAVYNPCRRAKLHTSLAALQRSQKIEKQRWKSFAGINQLYVLAAVNSFMFDILDEWLVTSMIMS